MFTLKLSSHAGSEENCHEESIVLPDTSVRYSSTPYQPAIELTFGGEYIVAFGETEN